MTRWTEEHTAEMLRMREKRASLQAIADKLGFTKQAIRYQVSKLSQERKQRRTVWTVEDQHKLESLVKQGLSNHQIAAAMQQRKETIKVRAAKVRKEHGIAVERSTRFEWTDELQQRAWNMRMSGHTVNEIVDDIGCSRFAIDHFIRKREADMRSGKLPGAHVAAPRTIVNVTMREPLSGSNWTPNRPGAMDYARVPSRGIA
ncbi:MAG: hypothetical protein ACK5NE_08560 [Brachymonas sp.]